MTSFPSPHHLNLSYSGHASNIYGVRNVHRRAVNVETPKTDDCMHEPYGRSSIRLGDVGVEEDRSILTRPFYTLLVNDVSPNARARFLQIVVDHFIAQHVVEMVDLEADQHKPDKLLKRKSGVVEYEGDPQFVLPLMYVTNMYETLVNEVDVRLASLDGFQGKTIGVDFEAMGGLYWKLAKMFPEKGPLAFKRRELAIPAGTRTKFPELVVQEDKGVRIVVVNGLNVVEKPNTLSIADAEWFKRLTGRSEVSISARDYKFYSPRHIYQRVVPNSLLTATDFPSKQMLPPMYISRDQTQIITTNVKFNNSKDLSASQCKSKQMLPPMYISRDQTQIITTNVKFNNSKDLSASQCKSKQMLPQIKDKDPADVTTLKEIFNTCDKPQVKDSGDLAILQHFFSKVKEDGHFLEEHRKAPGTDVVTDLVLSHAKSIALLRAFPYVLIIDAMYKENRYNVPFFKVLGYTPSGKNFNVACAFISEEREDNYVWLLKHIRYLCKIAGGGTPKTIVTMTDPGLELFNAVKQAFPRTKHLLGRPHIYKCIEGRCYEDMCAYHITTLFVNACKNLFESKTEDVYVKRLAFIETSWKSKQGLIGYLKQTWLTPYKDKIVSVWTDKTLHFGTHTMDRSGSSDFDKSLSLRPSSGSSFEDLWYDLITEIKGQSAQIGNSFLQLSTNVPPVCKRIAKLIKYDISNKAYEIMAQEYDCVKSSDRYDRVCMCPLRVSHGLPCAHEMEKYVANQTPIPIEGPNAVHRFWRQFTLDVNMPRNPSNKDFVYDFAVDLCMRFNEMSVDEHKRCEHATKQLESADAASEDSTPPKNFFKNFLFPDEGSPTPKILPHVYPTFGIHGIQKQMLPLVTVVGDRTILQQILTCVIKLYYFTRHRKASGTNDVSDLVFAHPDSLKLLRAFPHVLIIDATCKESRYNVPFFEVLGFTSTGRRFNVACAFISAEREDNFMWALNQISEICWFVGETPKTITTMIDQGKALLINVVEQAFPHTKHLLGRHPIYKNIKDRSLKDTSANSTATAFVDACKILFESETEIVYKERLAFMEDDWKSNKGLFTYLKQTWLTPYKDKIVSAWSDKVLHFGTHTMDGLETALKNFLSNSDHSFDIAWRDLHKKLESQSNSILHSFVSFPQNHKEIKVFESLQHSVSHKACEIMVQECVCVKSRDPSTCVCQLQASYGLPCPHEVAKYVADQTTIPLKAIHKFWQQTSLQVDVPDDHASGARAFVLDLFIRFRNMYPGERIRCKFAVNKIMQSVEEPPISCGRDPEPKDFSSGGNASPKTHVISSSKPVLTELYMQSVEEPPISCGHDPEPKDFSSGGNTSPKTVGISSNKPVPTESYMKPQCILDRPCNNPDVGNPHVHESPFNKSYVEPAEYIPEKPSNKSFLEGLYIVEVPNFMVPYVTDFYEDDVCGQSGFQAVAKKVEYGENGWRRVRADLFKELVSCSDVYAPVFVSDMVKKVLKALAVWTAPAYLPEGPEQQFSILDIGHIVATRYQLVFVVLGQQCVTFLPLYVDDQACSSNMNELCLVCLHHGKKFISVTMDKGFPLPPLHPLWVRYHQKSVDGLDGRYGDRFEKYQWFQSFMDPSPPLEVHD